MSKSSDTELDLELQLLPAWAKQSPDSKRFERYTGSEESRPQRREGFSSRRQDDRRAQDSRPAGMNRGSGPAGRRDSGDRRQGGDRRTGFDRRGSDARPGMERREPPAPLPEVGVSISPETKGVEGLARQIKLTGRAYPMFDIAYLILKKPERFNVTFLVEDRGESVAQPLFLCSLDESLWLSVEEALAHLLNRHFSTFYQTDRIPSDAPKGTYTFVAQCGISGVLLGPPNYHGYQTKLAKLHAERFPRMPFEAFKARVRIIRDEAVVKQWLDEASFTTEYTALNVPEPLKFPNRADVEKHLRETHLPNLVKPIRSHMVPGNAAFQAASPVIRQLARRAADDQVRFPLQLVNALCHQFGYQGLQCFKVNKTITHVSVARPHFLDLALTPVSDHIKRIIDTINATPRCNRRKLFDLLAPTPAAPPAAAPAPAATPEGGASPEQAPVAEVQPTAQQAALGADLHWLIHEGHVIEFANGTIETAKRPAPRPEPVVRPKAERPAGRRSHYLIVPQPSLLLIGP